MKCFSGHSVTKRGGNENSLHIYNSLQFVQVGVDAVQQLNNGILRPVMVLMALQTSQVALLEFPLQLSPVLFLFSLPGLHFQVPLYCQQLLPVSISKGLFLASRMALMVFVTVGLLFE